MAVNRHIVCWSSSHLFLTPRLKRGPSSCSFERRIAGLLESGTENQWIKVSYFDYPYSDDDLGLGEVLRLLRIRIAS
jgi:hypothetical protein